MSWYRTLTDDIPRLFDIYLIQYLFWGIYNAEWSKSTDSGVLHFDPFYAYLCFDDTSECLKCMISEYRMERMACLIGIANPKNEQRSEHEDANAAHKTPSRTRNAETSRNRWTQRHSLAMFCFNHFLGSPAKIGIIVANIIFSWTVVFCVFFLHSRCACFGSCNSIMRRKRCLAWCWQAIIG